MTRKQWVMHVMDTLVPIIRREAPTKECTRLAPPQMGYEYPAAWGLCMFEIHKDGLYYPVAPDGVKGEGVVTLREAKILAEKMVWAYRKRRVDEQSEKGRVAAWLKSSCSDKTWF